MTERGKTKTTTFSQISFAGNDWGLSSWWVALMDGKYRSCTNRVRSLWISNRIFHEVFGARSSFDWNWIYRKNYPALLLVGIPLSTLHLTQGKDGSGRMCIYLSTQRNSRRARPSECRPEEEHRQNRIEFPSININSGNLVIVLYFVYRYLRCLQVRVQMLSRSSYCCGGIERGEILQDLEPPYYLLFDQQHNSNRRGTNTSTFGDEFWFRAMPAEHIRIFFIFFFCFHNTGYEKSLSTE